jgi:hypothetical protein
MWAWLPQAREAPTATSVLEALQRRFGEGCTCAMRAPQLPIEASWEMECEVPDGERARQVVVWAQKSPTPESLHVQGIPLSVDEKAALQASRWSLGVVSHFGDDVLGDFQLQLQVLVAMAPNALAAFDAAACRMHHFEWVKESAASAAPPSPTSLFVMHFVSDEGQPGWLHTHGLARCGCLELEVFDVPRDASRLMGELVNSTAALLLERGYPEPGVALEVGRDLPLLWLPWEEALSTWRPKHGGGRDDRDELHGVPSGVLFAPKKKFLGLFGRKVALPLVHLPILEGSPVLYVSNAHTRRMEVLSRERLPTLRALFAKLGANEQFKFLVKLGFPTDGGALGGREHLWFELHAFDGETVEATCINAPHAVAALAHGLRAKQPLALTSDWTIFCPLGRFDAERVGVLVHLLDSAPEEVAKSLGLPS